MEPTVTLDKLKLAAYLDEGADEPAAACATLAHHKINYVVLRHVWSSNICNITDRACQQLRTLLSQHNLSVVAIISDMGLVDQSLLNKIPKEQIDRVFNVATYFQAGYVRIHAGIKSKVVDDEATVAWMQMLTERCLSANLVPLYEIMDTAAINEPAAVATLLAKCRRWRLLYDPAQLIIRRNQDPFTRYWTLLKKFVAAVDLKEFKIGHGFKPLGYGDTKLKLVVQDSGYGGWYFLEPALGRRYGSAASRAETFKFAFEALENLLT